jgi:hypothetical protein
MEDILNSYAPMRKPHGRAYHIEVEGDGLLDDRQQGLCGHCLDVIIFVLETR